MLTLIRCPFHPRVTAVPRKIPRSFYQQCRWQVTRKHAYILDPTKSEWADSMPISGGGFILVGGDFWKNVRPFIPTRNSSGSIRTLQSSQLAEPVWTDPGIKI